MRVEDALAVNEASPDYAGLIFAESRRRVSLEMAERIRNTLRSDIPVVGVFVDASEAEIAAVVDRGLVDMIQLHGGEDEDFIRAVKQRFSLPVIKAVRVRESADVLKYDGGCADYLLLDNGKGTGRRFDWRFISPAAIKKPWFFAGGIGEENLIAAARYHPFALDVSSGVETDGKKDRDKIIRLVREVREL